MHRRARAAAGELSAAAQQTMRRLCDRRSACGRCPACRAVLAVARRAPAASRSAASVDWDSASVEVVDVTPGAVERPTTRDAKAAWVDYAVAQGMDRGEAEATSKADLMAALA